MSVAIGASAAGARAYTATASQGLLYMVRGALQRVRARAADRDDAREPRDRRADQHLERPQRLDVPARLGLDPALRRDQPGGARPAHPGLQARGGAVAAGDGLHGRLHPHARLRARRRADPGAGGRLPARRSSRARCSTPPSRSRSARWSAPRRSSRSSTSCTPSRCRRSTSSRRSRRSSREAFGRDSGGLIRSYRTDDAETVVVALGSVLGTIEDVVDELREQGVKIGAVGIKCFRPYPARRGARGARPRASAWWCSRRRSPSGVGGIVGPERAPGAVGAPADGLRRGRRGSAGARSRSRRCTRCWPTRSRTGSSAQTFLDLDWEVVERELARRRRAPPGPARREHPARHRDRRRPPALGGRPMPYQQIKFYQAGSFVVGNRLLDAGAALGAGAHGALELAHLRPPRLSGLRRGARRALRARRRDARHRAAS